MISNSLLKLAMIVGLSSGLAVLMQSYKYLSMKHLGTILVYTIPGALIGTMMITYLASGLLIKLFSIILIIYGIINLFSKYYYSKSNKTKFINFRWFYSRDLYCRRSICFNGL